MVSSRLAPVTVCLLAGFLQAVEAHSPARAKTRTFSITTEPANAVVYIDGQPAGATPLNVDHLAEGTHRIRLTKRGYLENSRVIRVSSFEGGSLSVTLTPALGESAQAPASASPGTRTLNKWIWIGLAGGGAAVAAVALTRNHAPEPGAIVVTPTGTGMSGQTSFTFQSTATDSDKDSLSYAWNFGDGGSGSGQTATHTYSSAGTFQVSLAVGDGKQTVNPPNASVTVGPSLTGTWTG